MPANAVTLTATYENDTPPAPSTYAVTVNNGTGDGNYEENATVTITADAVTLAATYENDTPPAPSTYAVTEEATTTTDTQKDEVPKTGDHSPIVWLFVLVMVSGGTLLCLGRKKKTHR